MRPDQSRSVDYTKEYSSKANNRITRMLTAGINGIARDQDLYPTYLTESTFKVTGGCSIKNDELIHLGASRIGTNWNDFSVSDVIIDLTDANNYIQSSSNPQENIFDMPGYWPTDTTSSRAYIILSFSYIEPDETFYEPKSSKNFEADGYLRPQLSEEQNLEEGHYSVGQSPRMTPIKSSSFSTLAETKTFWPGANIPTDQEGSITVRHVDPDEIVDDWNTYHLATPGTVASVKILKDPEDFDPENHIFLGMVFFKEAKKIINPIVVFDYLLNPDPLDYTTYVTRQVLNFVQKYNDDRARIADSQNFITQHEANSVNINKLVVTGSIVDSPSGKIKFLDLAGLGSYINEVSTIWNGISIVVVHNFNQYVQIQVMDATSKESIQAEIVQNLNSFTVTLDNSETTPLPIIIRY